jgi:hypothetical protein
MENSIDNFLLCVTKIQAYTRGHIFLKMFKKMKHLTLNSGCDKNSIVIYNLNNLDRRTNSQVIKKTQTFRR